MQGMCIIKLVSTEFPLKIIYNNKKNTMEKNSAAEV